jgi:threonine 3-dehydrogenase
MKALVKSRPEPGLWMEDVPVPEPGPDDVLLRVRKTSICGTDLHIYVWDEWSRATIEPPRVIGHEFAGTVEALGSNVRDLRVGDLVTAEGHLVCGQCRNCQAGRRHLCPDTLGVGVHRDGAFAEFICVPRINVWVPHKDIAAETLSYFDPFGNATHAALSFDLVGEDVLITGAGPIGLMATAIARHVGARYVVVSDPNPHRLALAGKMGASLVLDPGVKSIADAQKQLGMTEGFDVGLEMSGNAEALRGMLANMVHGGRVALLGIIPGQAGIDWNHVIFGGLVLKGIYGRQMFETWYKMTSMLRSGLDVSPVLTHRFPVDRFEEGFEVMRSGNCGKVMLEWD